MATYKAPKRASRRNELREDTVITFYSKMMFFFEENRTLVFGIAGALVLLLIIGAGYGLYKDKREDQAQARLAGAVRAYERGEFQAALAGTEAYAGLEDIAGQYGNTNAGNLALYYAGDAYYRQGQFEEALTFFERFDKDDDALGSAAYAAEAAILENMGEFARAAERYQQAARVFETDFATPQYLLNAGRNFEMAGNFTQARALYERVEQEYPESAQAREIEYFLARVNVKAGE